MTCEACRDLAAMLVLDNLQEGDRQPLEAHLAGCASCREHMEGIQEAAAAIGLGVPMVAPPEDLRHRLFSRIVEPTVATGTSRRTPPARVWMAASIALALACGGSLAAAIMFGSQLAHERSRNAELASMLMSRQEQTALLLAGAVRVASLHRPTTPQGPVGQVFWNRQRHSWLVAIAGMPSAPVGKTYQLWAVTSSAKLSLGTFEPDAHGDAVVQADRRASGALAVAVSVEAAGGALQPKGAIVLVGALGHPS